MIPLQRWLGVVAILLFSIICLGNSRFVEVQRSSQDAILMEQFDVLWVTAESLVVQVAPSDLKRLQKSNIPFREFNPITKSLAQFSEYPTLEIIESTLAELSTHSFTALNQIGTSVEGRPIYALKISSNPTQNDPKINDTVIIGLQHAREWSGLVVALLFAQYLIENEATDAGIKSLIAAHEIWIIPVANPDGYVYSQTTHRTWRKNRSNRGDGTYGVDLNRNFDFQFDHPNQITDSDSDLYSGPSAFSEPETIAIQKLLGLMEVGAVLDLHAYAQMILIPWAFTNEPSPDDGGFLSLAQNFSEIILSNGGPNYTIGQPPNILPVVGTGVGGSLMDYAYATYNAPSFAIELSPTLDDPNGFTIDYDESVAIFNELKEMLISLVDISSEELPTTETQTSGGCGIP